MHISKQLFKIILCSNWALVVIDSKQEISRLHILKTLLEPSVDNFIAPQMVQKIAAMLFKK